MVMVNLLLSFLWISSIVLEIAVILGSKYKWTFVSGGLLMFFNSVLSVNLLVSTAHHPRPLQDAEGGLVTSVILSLGDIYLRNDFIFCYIVVFITLLAYAVWCALGRPKFA